MELHTVICKLSFLHFTFDKKTERFELHRENFYVLTLNVLTFDTQSFLVFIKTSKDLLCRETHCGDFIGIQLTMVIEIEYIHPALLWLNL